MFDTKYLRHCYNYGELCGPEHTKYDLDTRICGTGGCGSKLMKYETRPSSTNILRCSTRCQSGEFQYNGYCLNSCPVATFQYYDSNRVNTCINSCSDIINGNQCNTYCIGYIYDNRTCRSTCDRPFLYNEYTFTSSRSKWKVVSVDMYESGYEPYRALDGNLNTFWHTKWRNSHPPHPHWIIVDMGETYNISAVTYRSRQDSYTDGMIKDYELYLSLDGITWGTYVTKAQLRNLRSEQPMPISPPRICRYFKIVALSEISGTPHTHAAELGVIAHTLKYCTKSCGSRYIDGDYCQPSCSSGYYIKTNNDNIKICVPSDGCHVKSNDGNSPKYCYYSCTESGWPYYIGTTCYESCPADKPYHIEGQYKCLESCPDNYYLSDSICYCRYSNT